MGPRHRSRDTLALTGELSRTHLASRPRAHDDLSDELSLSPGAGSGIGKKLADALLAEPDFIELLKAAFMEALEAKQWFYDKRAKEWTSEPDYKTRLAAGQAILANLEGEPIKRVMVAQGGGKKKESDAKVIQRIASSPALQAALQAKLTSARGQGAVIDAETTTAKGDGDEADLD